MDDNIEVDIDANAEAVMGVVECLADGNEAESVVSGLMEELICRVFAGNHSGRDDETTNASESEEHSTFQMDEHSTFQMDEQQLQIDNWESFFDCDEAIHPTLKQIYCNSSFTDDNFLKGLKWSPCGNQLLACCNDNILSTFSLAIQHTLQTPHMDLSSQCYEGGDIYDFSWYPGSSIHEPPTCCFVSTSRGQPVHLWDPLTGLLRCSYRPYNAVDEMESAISISFDSFGDRIFCGFNGCVRVFHTCRPGRQFELRPTYANKRGQNGLISCFAFNQSQAHTYACGSYAKTVSICDDTTGEVVMVFSGHTGGITHLEFSNDGHKLFSGGRKDGEILCWDLRKPGHVLKSLGRRVTTNQRIYFNLNPTGTYLASGEQGGGLLLWDDGAPFQDRNHVPPSIHHPAHLDTLNSLTFHPWYPIIATGSGQRHLSVPCSDDDDDDNDDIIENSIKLWLLNR